MFNIVIKTKGVASRNRNSYYAHPLVKILVKKMKKRVFCSLRLYPTLAV